MIPNTSSPVSLVEELRQAHALGALESRLHAQPAQQRAHAEVAAHGRQKLHKALLLVPGRIVQHRKAAPRPPIGEELLVVGGQGLQPAAQRARVGPHLLSRQRLALLGAAARVSQARRGTSHQRDHVVACSLEVEQALQRQQMPHMKRVGRGVEAAVNGLGRVARRPPVEELGELSLCSRLWEELLEQTPSLLCRQKPLSGGM